MLAFYILIVVLIVFVLLVLVLNLLLNPLTWIIIGVLILASMIRRRAYRQRVEDFNKEFQQKTQEKKQYYYQNTTSYKHDNNEDIIDVDYKVVDEEKEWLSEITWGEQ
jgi:ABC-type bacteriocin/lantibiotic exporter with double-glycine peptidase domain